MTIRTTFKQPTGGVTKRRDRREWTSDGRLAILFSIDRSVPAAPTPQCAESVPLFAAQKGFRVGAQARRKPWRL